MFNKRYDYSNDRISDMRRLLKLADQYNSKSEDALKQIV